MADERTRALSLAFVALLGLSGCGSKPPPPTMLDGTIATSDDVNPDPSGGASPVVVRLYELKSQTGFAGADFFALWDKDQATLGADMKAKDEYHMTPTESRKISKTLDPDTHIIGVIVGYRNIDGATWRATGPVTANHVNAMTVRVGRNAVALSIAAQ
jgi:type VI secretion system protein VasD